MSEGAGTKSLKDQNRWQLWLTIAANVAVFYVVLRADALATLGWKGFLTAAIDLLPIGLALIVVSVANGLLSASLKARLVFLRWTHALPGHRAFSTHAHTDPRIDLTRVKRSIGNRLPKGPEAENSTWYRIFKDEEAAPEVQHIHREFLFMRDYTAFAALFLVGLGIAAAVLVPWRVALIYSLGLLAQLIIVRHAAATYGNRFVCTVLAVRSAKASTNRRKTDTVQKEGGAG